MAGGYMGKFLWVDLTTGEVRDEPLDPQTCRDYIGGYGLGARILYDRIPKGADPLGPQNVLGVLTGPLTGTSAIEGNRSVFVCKSPLTDGWGDANCGGTFGAHLKFAGYDAVFVTGQATSPKYVWIEDGKAELRDADDLWGKCTRDLEATLKARHGRETQVASIGPAGENVSLIASIMNDEGRAWGRSGVGAVMGSKRLKAIAVKGSARVPVAEPEKIEELRRSYIKQGAGAHDLFVKYGTLGITGESSITGDSPVKNWGGSGVQDFPTGQTNLKDDRVIQWQERKYGCYRCTLACGGIMSTRPGDEPYHVVKGHKPEYESAAAFGSMLLNDHFGSLIKANEMCNEYGFDTIAAGVTLAFAIECYENGILTKEDTGGLELTWRNHEAALAMLEKMASREGLGNILADGTRKASQRIGRGSEQYAMHVQGAEVPMHDPKFEPSLALTYKIEGTPARHTQGGAYWFPPGYEVPADYDKYVYSGKGEIHKWMSNWMHVVNASGMCMFAFASYPYRLVPDFLTAVTGVSYDEDEVYRVGERIANLRLAFCVREGDNPVKRQVPGRLIGNPPLTHGNVRGITVDLDAQVGDYCRAMDWDPETGLPSLKKLRELGLEAVAGDLGIG